MKTTMRLLTIMASILVLGIISVNAQNEITPAPAGFVLHGHNSSDVATASENTDSVSVGAVVRYWVEPDASLANGANTYAWTIPAAVGSQTAGGVTNLTTVTMAATPGTGNIQVVESTAASCASGTTTSIPVSVLALPTITYPAAGGTAGTCGSGTDGSLAISIPALNINWTSSVKGARLLNLQYDLTGPAGFTAVTNSQVNIAETGAGTGTFAVTQSLTHYGTYTITLKSAADRISTKCTNMRNSGGITNATYTFIVNRPPITGPIYHLPNL